MNMLKIEELDSNALWLSRVDVSSQWFCEAFLAKSSDGLAEGSDTREDELLQNTHRLDIRGMRI